MIFHFGWAQGVDGEQCAADPAVKSRMLCGRKRGHVPVHQTGIVPVLLHDECRRRMDKRGGQGSEVGEYGTCAECLGDVPVVGGVVVPHGQWVPRDRVLVVGSKPCAGAGAMPEVEG